MFETPLQLTARGGLFLSPLRRGFFCFGDARQAPGDLKREKLAGRETFLEKGSPFPPCIPPSFPKTFILNDGSDGRGGGLVAGCRSPLARAKQGMDRLCPGHGEGQGRPNGIRDAALVSVVCYPDTKKENVCGRSLFLCIQTGGNTAVQDRGSSRRRCM